MVVSEGMELIFVFGAIMIMLGLLVWIQKWSGLT